MNVVWITNMNNIWIIFRFCYGQKVCVLWKFVCWSLNPQCDGICREGLWEVIRVRWSHEDGAPWWDWRPQKQRALALCLCLSPFTRARWKGRVRIPWAACQPGSISPGPDPAVPPNPACRTVRNTFLLCKSPSLCHLHLSVLIKTGAINFTKVIRYQWARN